MEGMNNVRMSSRVSLDVSDSFTTLIGAMKLHHTWRCVLTLVLLVSVTFLMTYNGTTISDNSAKINNGKELPPCGDVCSYQASVLNSTQWKLPQLHKNMNCQNILGRMAYTNHSIIYPPPRAPPRELFDEFTQFGDCPIKQNLYMTEFSPLPSRNIRTKTMKHIHRLIANAKLGVNINPYMDRGCVMSTLKAYTSSIAGSSSVVIGTQEPWLESMLVAGGVGRVTTLEYAPLVLIHPQLSVYTPHKYARMYTAGNASQFDFGVTYSSLEHSGLGRYGDPINPFGDLEAMAQVWCMMRPGGVFIVGVPGSEDDSSYIVWNAHRVYGSKRLQHMASNWEVLDIRRCHDKYKHVLLVLQKPH